MYLQTLISTTVLVLLVAQQVTTLKPSPRIDEPSRFNRNLEKSNQFKQSGDKHQDKHVERYIMRTEIEERILINEPYKSLIQTTTRFALAQSGVSRHVDIETVMDIVNDTGYMLSRPSVFSKAKKVATVAVVTALTVVFFFPNSIKHPDEVLRKGTKVFGQMFPNGILDESVIRTLGSRPDDLIERFGLASNSCREHMLCRTGQFLATTFPQSSNSLIKFAKENLSSRKYRENRYIDVFLSGFADRNCSSFVAATEEEGIKQTCIANIFDSSFDFFARCPKANSTEQEQQQQQANPKFQIVKPLSKSESD